MIREKVFHLNNQLDLIDWDTFFNSKAEWNDELDHLTALTKAKLRQVVFRMLREADILTPENAIQSTVLSPRVVNVIQFDNKDLLTIYPTLERF